MCFLLTWGGGAESLSSLRRWQQFITISLSRKPENRETEMDTGDVQENMQMIQSRHHPSIHQPGGILRCSQANWEIHSLQCLLDLPPDLLLVGYTRNIPRGASRRIATQMDHLNWLLLIWRNNSSTKVFAAVMNIWCVPPFHICDLLTPLWYYSNAFMWSEWHFIIAAVYPDVVDQWVDVWFNLRLYRRIPAQMNYLSWLFLMWRSSLESPDPLFTILIFSVIHDHWWGWEHRVTS